MSQITAAEIQNSLAEMMSKKAFLPNASPNSIMIETQSPNQFYRFSVRLNSIYKVLPTPAQVKKTYEQTGQKGEGSMWLMFGAVQVMGDRVRVTIRIVKTETGVVAKASFGDGEATFEGLSKAIEKALLGLSITYVC
ncbi:MAG TPA: hypothetical protein PKY82_02900 [Pyrinomonadaceae bacterium]|nr:hypothetical protein [Pyrinomonadaceae bacterium]